MTTFTEYAIPANVTPVMRPGVTPLNFKVTAVVATWAANDVINLGKLLKGFSICWAKVWVKSTLGASCTVQLRVGTTAITAASTAAATSLVVQNAGIEADANNDRDINLLVAGAAVGTAGVILVDVMVADTPQIAV
jgi:hypothetical protein